MILPDARLLVLAFWLGAALALLYAAVRVLSLLLSLGKCTVFLLDVLFCAVCGVCTFLLALAGSNGQPRLYWLVFEAGGYYCMHITLARLILFCTQSLLAASRSLCGRIKEKKGKIRGTGGRAHRTFRKSSEKTEKKT